MTKKETLDTIKHVKKIHENIVIAIGIFAGVLLILYFFTFAIVVDKGLTGVLWFQFISSVMLVLALIFIRRLGFSITKILLHWNKRYQPILQQIKITDLSLTEQELVNRFD